MTFLEIDRVPPPEVHPVLLRLLGISLTKPYFQVVRALLTENTTKGFMPVVLSNRYLASKEKLMRDKADMHTK